MGEVVKVTRADEQRKRVIEREKDKYRVREKNKIERDPQTLMLTE